jgi:uncharacterized protein YjiS (DUF1127 family)
MGTVYGMWICAGAPAPPTIGAMMLRLTLRDFLTLQGARGTAIDVLVGRVWITEDGRAGDSFVDAGRSYRVGGHGLVLIGAENQAHAAEVVVRHQRSWETWTWMREEISNFLTKRQTRDELRALPDSVLRDIGLRREQLY